MAYRFDPQLLEKLAGKINKSVNYTRQQLPKRANRHGVSSEAYFLYWLQRENIGAQTYKRSLSSEIQNEARSITQPAQSSIDSKITNPRQSISNLTGSSRYIDLLEIIQDPELKDRCSDLIKRPRNHDRVFREATTVLEHRIKSLSNITQRLNPQPLISKAISPDPTRAILVVSSEPSEQEGFYKICSGIEATFRNRTHHEISDKMTRYDAIKFCSFIDSLLQILGDAEVRQDRI